MKKYKLTKSIDWVEIEVLYELSENAITDDDHTAEFIAGHIDVHIEDVQKALDSLVAKGMLEVKE